MPPAPTPPPAPDPRILALVADRTHHGVILADAGGRIEWVNAGFTRITGYAPAEVVGRRPGPLLQGPETDPHTVALMRDRIRAGEGFTAEVLNYRKVGSPYWAAIEVRPIRDAAGALTHFMAIEQDITDRKQAEQDRRVGQARLAEAQRIARVGSWVWEPGGDRTWWSEESYRLFGLDPSGPAPSFERFLALVHPDDRAAVRGQMAAVAAGADTYAHDIRVVRADGRTVWVHSRAVPARDAAGRLIRLEGINQDITERKWMEDTIRSTLTLQTAVLNSAAALVIAADPAGTVTVFNQAAELALGYAADEVVGRATPALWHDPAEVAARAAGLAAELGREVPPGFEVFVTRAAAGGPETREWTFVRKDRTTFPVELTVTALADPGGAVRGFLGVATDITRRRADSAALRELTDRLVEQNTALEEQGRLATLRAEVVQVLNETPGLPDLLGRACEAIRRHTGAGAVGAWTLDEGTQELVLRATAGTAVSGDDRVPVGAAGVGRVAETRAPHLTNDLATDPHADREWADREGPTAFAGFPLACDGRLIGVLAVYAAAPIPPAVADCLAVVAAALALGVARKRSATAAREEAARHRAVVEASPDPIITIDAAGRVVEFNAAAERTFGYHRAEVIGRPLPDFLEAPAVDALLGAGGSGAGRRAVVPAVRNGGERFPAELSVVPAEVEGDRVLTVFLRDVSAEQAIEARRREAEQHLQLAKESAEAAAEAQQQFLANMSHELRTPVAALVGFAELLADPGLGAADRARAADAIARSGRHLTALVNNVLDLGKAQAGRVEVERVPCRVRRLVADSAAVAGAAADERRVAFRVVPTGPLPARVTTDPTRVRQILDNLLANAVKFTDPGRRVELRVRFDPAPAPGAGGRLVFEVADEGIGIAPAALARLFQPFTQSDPSTTRKYGGTGLGLSISKHLARLLGGDLAARSTPGAGTCMTFALPVPPGDARDLIDLDARTHDSDFVRPAAPARRRPAGRVLLAEDTPYSQTILRFFLERAGFTVAVVGNGREAVAAALAGAFDVVLMDMQMPEMDGYEATAALRRRGYTRPVVALTAHALPSDEEKCRRAGCDGYLTKPIGGDELVWAVAGFLPPRGGPPPPPATPPPSSGLARITAEYARTLPERGRAVAAALGDGDAAVVAGLAHKLRGSAGMYGFAAVTAAAGRVEEAARDGRPPADLGPLVAELVRACSAG